MSKDEVSPVFLGAADVYAAQVTELQGQNATQFGAVIEAINSIKKKTLQIKNVEVQAVPNKAYFLKIVANMEPSWRIWKQRQMHDAYKSMFFIKGKGVKEGSRVYQTAVLVDKTGAMVDGCKLDKDRFKAAAVCAMLQGVVVGADATGYWTSKGFRKFVIGKTTKSKHSKSHPRNKHRHFKASKGHFKKHYKHKYKVKYGGVIKQHNPAKK